MNHEAVVGWMIENLALVIVNNGPRRTDQAAGGDPGKNQKDCATKTKQQEDEAQSAPISQGVGLKKAFCRHAPRLPHAHEPPANGA